MGFYYTSLFSVVPLGVAYGVLALIYWGVVRGTRRIPARKSVLAVVAAVFLVAPIAEELWIAWNFGQACKEAGTAIYKKVQVDGFYDASMRTAYENTKPGRFRFVEQATEDGKGFERVERVDDESRARALAWYSAQNPGKSLPNSVIYPVDDNVRIEVVLSGIGAWKVTKLGRPTARYHYIWPNPHGDRVAYKVGKSERFVIDTDTKERIAKYTAFGRRPPWFFIGLDIPAFACDAPGRWPLARDNPLIYREVLLPAGQK
jgi:hypothetical protein